MKTMLTLLLLTLLTVGCGGEDKTPTASENGSSSSAEDTSSGTPPEPEALAKAVFEALKAEDFGKIEALYIKMDDLDAVLGISTIPEDKKPELLEEWPKIVEMVRSRAREGFDEILADGKRAGIGWGAIEYDKTEAKEKERNGLKQADIYLHFKHGDKPFKVHLDDAQRSERGWHLVFLSLD